MTDKLTAKSFELSSSEIALVYTEKSDSSCTYLEDQNGLCRLMLTYTGSSARMVKWSKKNLEGLMRGPPVQHIGKLG